MDTAAERPETSAGFRRWFFAFAVAYVGCLALYTLICGVITAWPHSFITQLYLPSHAEVFEDATPFDSHWSNGLLILALATAPPLLVVVLAMLFPDMRRRRMRAARAGAAIGFLLPVIRLCWIYPELVFAENGDMGLLSLYIPSLTLREVLPMAVVGYAVGFWIGGTLWQDSTVQGGNDDAPST